MKNHLITLGVLCVVLGMLSTLAFPAPPKYPATVSISQPSTVTVTPGTELRIVSEASDPDGDMFKHTISITRPNGEVLYPWGWDLVGSSYHSTKDVYYRFTDDGTYLIGASAWDRYEYPVSMWHAQQVQVTVADEQGPDVYMVPPMLYLYPIYFSGTGQSFADSGSIVVLSYDWEDPYVVYRLTVVTIPLDPLTDSAITSWFGIEWQLPPAPYSGDIYIGVGLGAEARWETLPDVWEGLTEVGAVNAAAQDVRGNWGYGYGSVWRWTTIY